MREYFPSTVYSKFDSFDSKWKYLTLLAETDLHFTYVDKDFLNLLIKTKDIFRLF
jgi:hypothetical protein